MSGQNAVAVERGTNRAGQTSINGNPNETNKCLLDGVEINETINNVIGYNPSPDELDQVQVISANAPDEYGNVNGGDVITVTESGTNRYHGSVFGFLENYNLDANSWFNNDQTPIVPKNHSTQTTFGGTPGGDCTGQAVLFC